MCIDTYTEYGCWHIEVVYVDYHRCKCSVVVGSRNFPDEKCTKKCGAEARREMKDVEKVAAIEKVEAVKAMRDCCCVLM
jgi:hypothetical protein